jgi:hypothetical protein
MKIKEHIHTYILLDDQVKKHTSSSFLTGPGESGGESAR